MAAPARLGVPASDGFRGLVGVEVADLCRMWEHLLEEAFVTSFLWILSGALQVHEEQGAGLASAVGPNDAPQSLDHLPAAL